MGLETGNFIPELDENNPLGGDPKSEGDDHIRLVKRCTQGSFPAFVGSTATPKSVSLTEDQINDAALKSAAQTIDGAWIYTGVQKFTNPTAGATSSLNVEGTVPGVLWHETDASADEGDWRVQVNGGSMSINTRNDAGNGGATAMLFKRALTAVTGIEHSIGGTNVAEMVSSDLGSLLVEPIAGTRRKVGFRNPVFISQGGPYTFLQDDEGKVVYKVTASSEVYTVPSLEAGTCITFLNRSQFTQTLVESGVVMDAALGGDNKVSPITVAKSSIVQLYWLQTGTCIVWGNGIT